jgi:uncharacterized membrane protein YphA (DoxX/SURF4 family)
MSLRESLAVGAAPLFLRLALGITFLWAGMSKVFYETGFEGQDAATLANYGVIQPGAVAPLEPIAFRSAELASAFDAPVAQEGQEGVPDQDELERRNRQPDGSPPPPLDDEPASPVFAGPGYSASDFPVPVMTRSLHNITLMLHKSMRPGVHPETSQPTIPLWFDADPTREYDQWPVYAAWAVALTELIGGGLVLLGLLTRLSALSLAGTMAGALWLATIGPMVQVGSTPELMDLKAWSSGLWQFALLMCALALFCTGSGGVAIDRLLFGNPFFYRAPEPAKQPAK